MRTNPILRTDSYKASHFLQYPPNTTSMFSYLESRGGRFGSTVFFGLQYLLEEYLTQPVTMGDVAEADAFLTSHGEPFNRAGWERIVNKFGGYMPVRIRAVPEGTVVPMRNVLMTVESTDPETFWIVSWLETQLCRLWYPITVATRSWNLKKLILDELEQSANDPLQEIDFKLHDFGARGASTSEAAGVGGMSHLVNFKGTDTIEGALFAQHYYGVKGLMPGFSIPAAEHSAITMWGRERELDAYRNMLAQFAKPGAKVACVSDSFDLWNAIDRYWTEILREDVERSGAQIILRPDSGDPKTVVLRCLEILERKVGMTKNHKGFKVLPDSWRVIQGDGVDEESIREILFEMRMRNYSASNIAFGIGGALLQKLDRDTQRFAYKCSSATVDGVEVNVQKDPITDPTKKSKAGRLDLVHEGGVYSTVIGDRKDSVLRTVYENGEIKIRDTFDKVRERALRGML